MSFFRLLKLSLLVLPQTGGGVPPVVWETSSRDCPPQHSFFRQTGGKSVVGNSYQICRGRGVWLPGELMKTKIVTDQIVVQADSSWCSPRPFHVSVGEGQDVASKNCEDPSSGKPGGGGSGEEAGRDLWLSIEWQRKRESGGPEQGALFQRGKQAGDPQWVIVHDA